jgi:hypothetical protein
VPLAIAAPWPSALWLTLPAFWVILLSADDMAGGLVNERQRAVVWTIADATVVLTIHALRDRHRMATPSLLPRSGRAAPDASVDLAA